MKALCSTHGKVEARVTIYGDGTQALHCHCGLAATKLKRKRKTTKTQEAADGQEAQEPQAD